MAERLKRLPRRRWMAVAALLTGVVLNPAGRAETLPDPTRPPLAALPGGAAAQEQGEGEAVLQSVLISPARKEAIISGQTVPLGGRFGAARLIGIGEGEVVLQTGDVLKTLKLYPAVDKRAAQEKSSAKQPNGHGGKRRSE